MRVKIVLIIVLSLACVAVSPFIGPALEGAQGGFILWNLRLPRTLMAVLAGAMLSLVGASYQTVLHNPMAEPGTVGTMAGATLGAVIAVVSGVIAPAAGLPMVTLFAFAGALIVSLALTAIASSGRASVNDVLLAGIAIALMASAVATGLQFTADQASTLAAVRWALGHLAQVGYADAALVAVFVVPVSVLLLLQTPALDAISAGEDRAFSQGVDVPKLRALVLGLGALGVAACVAWCGPIVFVGLVVPHLVRLGVGASRRLVMPLSPIAGAGFLAVCDMISRVLLPQRELPVGVITAAIGAPMLVWLVVRQRR
ncbi:MAG: iron ABC transporter permease [Planctomycetes bacterium]|nr:iron ABC transporter permease [Planctomycetota bacterium]